MANHLEVFCRQVRQRSTENRKAVQRLSGLHGQIVSILRQELDSMVRIIYLLSISDRKRRTELIEASVEGREWTHANSRKRITDREMVDLANELQHWTRSVYRFGCAFIHLSSFHDYRERDPMEMITEEERRAILDHMRYYHAGPVGDHPSFREMVPYLPAVLEKISGNLECCVKSLEENHVLDE